MGKKQKIILGFVALGIIALAGTGAARPPDGALRVIVDDDSVRVTVESAGGKTKSLALARGIVEEATDTSAERRRPDFQIRDEIIIEGDKIVIDGAEFTIDEINRMLISRDRDKSITLRAGFPHIYDGPNAPKITKAERLDSNDRVGFSGLTIGQEDVVQGDAVSLTGDVNVFGRVKGDIVSVFGNIYLYDGSIAGGDVVAPFGKVITSGDINIKGTQVSQDKKYRSHKSEFEVSARFNRVEGFTPLAGIHYTDRKKELPDIDFSLGYAFALKRWDFNFGFKQALGSTYYFGGKLYQGVYTPDRWFFSESENTVAGLFFKEDYHDFYKRKGGQIFWGRKFWQNGHAQLEYTAQANNIVSKHTNKAILGGKKNFRENYSTILPDSASIRSIKGDLRSAGLHLAWDSRDKKPRFRSGQSADILLETAGDGLLGDLGGDFSYDIVEGSLAHIQNLTRRQYLGIRIRGGLSNDQLPLDRWYFLGGVGSLRGYDYKEYAGNRYVLANIDYYWDFWSDFTMAVFTDFGQAGFGKNDFEKMGLKSDIGIGLMFEDDFRIDLAQRLDDTDKSPVITGRLELQF